MTAPGAKAWNRSVSDWAALAHLRHAWPRAKKSFFIVSAIVILGLVAWRAREIDWNKVLGAVRALPLSIVAMAALIAFAAHATYVGYDLLARRYTGHRIGLVRTIAIAAVCFAFNLNLGGLVGGVALRYRLYGRFGLHAPLITRIVGFCLVTNWIGYSALGGAAFASGLVNLPADAPISGSDLRALGLAMLFLAMGYLAASHWSSRRRWSVFGHSAELPRARMALLQFGLSMAHWSLVALVLTVLLQGEVGFVTVLGAVLAASMAGLITHIPAGLGVLEAVVVALLAYPINTLLAALLAYRAVYYLVPLAIAALVYVPLELAARRSPTGSEKSRRSV
jgi:uncharacterized membrane protein YbhN (UPF0104 family)